MTPFCIRYLMRKRRGSHCIMNTWIILLFLLSCCSDCGCNGSRQGRGGDCRSDRDCDRDRDCDDRRDRDCGRDRDCDCGRDRDRDCDCGRDRDDDCDRNGSRFEPRFDTRPFGDRENCGCEK